MVRIRSKKAIMGLLAVLMIGGSFAYRPVQASANPVMTVYWDEVNQTIDGFGAAGHSRSQTLMNMSDPAKSEILDLLFSTTVGASGKDGIGLSILRSGIGDGGKTCATCAPYSTYALDTIEPEQGQWVYTGDTAQKWLMSEAKNRGVSTFFSTAWSAPYWMKSNLSVIGGSLATNMYQAYADYLAAYAKAYPDTTAISIQNEPDASTSYSSSTWTASQFDTFVRDYLKPTFASQGVTTKVILGEKSSWSEDIVQPTIDDPNAVSAVDIVAGHNYGYTDSSTVAPFTDAQSKGKKVWMTEVSNPHTNDSSITDGLLWAKNIYKHMVDAHTNAWLYWRLVMNANTGEGLINIDPTTNTYTTNKRLYTLGNYSKFIRPGYVNITADSSNPAANIYGSAYRDPNTGKFVVVMINDGTSSQSIDVDLNGFTASAVTPYRTSATEDLAQQADVAVTTYGNNQKKFTADLPAQSVTTYVGSGSRADVAQSATPVVDSTYDSTHTATMAIDGITNTDASRWLSGSATSAHTYELDWTRPKTISSVNVWSGYMASAGYQIKAYDVQTWNGSAWVTQASVTGNTSDGYAGQYNALSFSPVSTTKLRLNIITPSAKGDNIARLLELKAQ